VTKAVQLLAVGAVIMALMLAMTMGLNSAEAGTQGTSGNDIIDGTNHADDLRGGAGRP
jgi:hypothetical protein